MSIEVPCPQCKSILKAPEGLGGKKARCKRCQHSFRLPGGNANDAQESTGDPEQLSVVTDAPFAFSPPTGIEINDPVETKPDPKSKSKYKTKADKASHPSPVKQSKYRSHGGPSAGGKGKTVLLLGALLLCAGGGAAGFYVYTEYQKSKAVPQPSANATADTPPDKELAKKTDDSAKKTKSDANPAPTAPSAGATGRDGKGSPRAVRGGPKVSGGMKLPAFSEKPTPYEKPTATLALDHDAKVVKQVLIGGAEGPVVLVMRRTFDGLGGKGMRDTIDRYALNTLRRIDQTEVPADAVKAYPRIGDVSPGGDRFAFEHPAGKLSVVQLGTKTVLVDGLELSSPEAKDEPKHPGISAIYFLSDDKLAVVTANGVVESWDLAAKKRVGASEAIPGAANLVDRRSLALHRDRDPEKSRVFAFAGGAIHAVPPGGKPQLALALPHGARECLALAVDGSGNRIAAAYRATEPGEHVRFLHARVGDPKPGADESLDAEIGLPTLAEWTRPETFGLYTDKGLGLAWDADTNQLIAGFRTPTPTIVAADGSKHWVLLPDAKDAKKAVLVNATLPPEDYSPSLTGEKWKPLALTITADGTAK